MFQLLSSFFVDILYGMIMFQALKQRFFFKRGIFMNCYVMPNGRNGSALTCRNASSCTRIFLSVCLQVFMAEIICPVIEVGI